MNISSILEELSIFSEARGTSQFHKELQVRRVCHVVYSTDVGDDLLGAKQRPKLMVRLYLHRWIASILSLRVKGALG